VKSAEWANQQFRTLRTAMFAPERLLFYLSGQHGEFSPPAEMAMSITPDPKGGLCLVFARLEQLFLL